MKQCDVLSVTVAIKFTKFNIRATPLVLQLRVKPKGPGNLEFIHINIHIYP